MTMMMMKMKMKNNQNLILKSQQPHQITIKAMRNHRNRRKKFPINLFLYFIMNLKK